MFDAVLRLVQSRHWSGEAVKVFGLWDECADADLPAWNPVPVAAFKPGRPGMIGRSPGFLEELRAFAPDICHTHGLWAYPGIAATRYGRDTGRPCIVSPHGMLDPWALNNSRWKKKIAWALFEGAQLRGARCLRALCVSEARSIRQLGLKNDIAIIPNGIDLPENENAETLTSETLTSGNAKDESRNVPWQDFVEPGKKVLLFLSRIHPKKGLLNLLKAWSANRQSAIGNRQSDEWVLAIAGWDQGGHEAELKHLCTELQVPFADIRETKPAVRGQCSVVFLGPQFNEAKTACYRNCDAFILPSFSEGLPMVVLEAWAYSKPVLMTPECNLPEGFQASAAIEMAATETGIAGGLNELQRMSVADRQAMGSRARNLVEKHFTWERVGDQLQSVQEWILGGGPKPGCILDA